MPKKSGNNANGFGYTARLNLQYWNSIHEKYPVMDISIDNLCACSAVSNNMRGRYPPHPERMLN